ncbi:MAG: hypothetical protein ACTHKG_04315 [Nocardioides sp.]
MRHKDMKPVAALVLLLLAGCSGSTDAGRADAGGAASCADLVRYDGHRYHGHGELQRMPATTRPAGTATRLGCDDGNGASPDEDIEVVELRDVPLGRGFLSHGQLYVRDDLDFPPAARVWFEPVRCTGAETFAMTGQWLGVESSREVRFDGDIRPPYRLTAWVTKGPAEYVDTRVTVHADEHTDPQLGPDDVRGSLWEGGDVTAQVHCKDGRFVADGLTTP